MVVTRPSQEPARVFSLSKALCESDGAFWASDCATVTVASEISVTRDRMERKDLIFILLELLHDLIALAVLLEKSQAETTY